MEKLEQTEESEMEEGYRGDQAGHARDKKHVCGL